MSYVSKTFTNECGNLIGLSVEELRSVGTNYREVHIAMSGPRSETTNTITRMEAEELRDALTQVLD